MFDGFDDDAGARFGQQLGRVYGHGAILGSTLLMVTGMGRIPPGICGDGGGAKPQAAGGASRLRLRTRVKPVFRVTCP